MHVYTHVYAYIGNFHLICINPCLYENEASKRKRVLSTNLIEVISTQSILLYKIRTIDTVGAV